MKNTQIEAFQYLFVKTVQYRNEPLAIIGTSMSITLSTIEYLTNTEFLGISLMIFLITCVMFVSDLVLGITASKKLPDYKGIESEKISYTIIKFIVFFIWIVLSSIIKDQYKDVEWFQYIISSIVTFPLILIMLREFVSMGEKIEIIYGKKPYIFSLVDRLFDVIENKFFDKLKTNNNE